MAQPGSALVWGTRGRWFKSSRPDQSVYVAVSVKVKVRESNEISFMVFAKSSGKSLTFNITESRLKTIIISVIFAILILFLGIYLSYNTNLKEAAYNQLKKKTKFKKSN